MQGRGQGSTHFRHDVANVMAILSKDPSSSSAPPASSASSPLPSPFPWWRRGCCLRGCCTPWCALLSLVLSTCFFFLVLLPSGVSVERAAFEVAPSTASMYDSPQVCAVNGTTYASAGSAHAAKQKVRHCGGCGVCSNTRDIRIYNETLATLTSTATACAMGSFLGEDMVRGEKRRRERRREEMLRYSCSSTQGLYTGPLPW